MAVTSPTLTVVIFVKMTATIPQVVALTAEHDGRIRSTAIAQSPATTGEVNAT